jgi:hypothetical protein
MRVGRLVDGQCVGVHPVIYTYFLNIGSSSRFVLAGQRALSVMIAVRSAS